MAANSKQKSKQGIANVQQSKHSSISIISLVISILSLLSSFAIGAYALLQPEIVAINDGVFTRKISTFNPIEKSTRMEINISAPFKNIGLKPGYIDKIELIPDSRTTIKPVSLYIDKDSISWQQEKKLTIIAIWDIGQYSAGTDLSATFRFFDNTGKIIKNSAGNIHAITVPFFRQL